MTCPSVAFRTVFDPFAPFTGRGDVPATGDQVVPVEVQLPDAPGNQYGNNASFAQPGSDPGPMRARSLYGQTHAGGSVGHQLERGGPVPS